MVEERNKTVTGGKKLRKKNWRAECPFLLFLLPALILVVLMHYLPYAGLLSAFKEGYKSSITGAKGFEAMWNADWVGFQNFKLIFTDDEVLGVVWNTIKINLLNIVFEFPAPIILAVLIIEVTIAPLKKSVQTISYLPHFLSMVAVTSVVSSIVSNNGLLDSMCALIGVDYTPLSTVPSAFIPVYIVTNVWKTIGWNSILYLAAIVGVNKELYEAASIDGANRFQQILFIMLPGIIPTIMMVFIMRIGNLLSSNFELVQSLSNKTGWDLDVISTWVYRKGIGKTETQGLATAVGIIQAIITFALVTVANKVSEKVANISMW